MLWIQRSQPPVSITPPTMNLRLLFCCAKCANNGSPACASVVWDPVAYYDVLKATAPTVPAWEKPYSVYRLWLRCDHHIHNPWVWSLHHVRHAVWDHGIPAANIHQIWLHNADKILGDVKVHFLERQMNKKNALKYLNWNIYKDNMAYGYLDTVPHISHRYC